MAIIILYIIILYTSKILMQITMIIIMNIPYNIYIYIDRERERERERERVASERERERER